MNKNQIWIQKINLYIKCKSILFLIPSVVSFFKHRLSSIRRVKPCQCSTGGNRAEVSVEIPQTGRSYRTGLVRKQKEGGAAEGRSLQWGMQQTDRWTGGQVWWVTTDQVKKSHQLFISHIQIFPSCLEKRDVGTAGWGGAVNQPNTAGSFLFHLCE